MNDAVKAWMKPEGAYFSELQGVHEGEAAFIMGGGLSLPESIKKFKNLKRKHIKISVNAHALRLLTCDYVVFLDNKKIGQELETFANVPPRITWQRNEADYMTVGHWHASNSSKYAVWCAWQMGCYPIVLVGMDCYGGGTYFHDPEASSSGARTPVRKHVEDWDRDVRSHLPHVRDCIRVIDGPLEAVFGTWDPKEKFARPTMPWDEPLIREAHGEVDGVLIQFLVGMKHKHEIYQKGEVARIDKAFAEWAIVRNRAKYWEGPPPDKRTPFE